MAGASDDVTGEHVAGPGPHVEPALPHLRPDPGRDAGERLGEQQLLGAQHPQHIGQGDIVRPREALAWNRPHDVHTGVADPLVPNFPEPENLPVT